MNWYKNMKTTKKLLLGFAIVMAVAVAVGAVGIYSIQTFEASGKLVYDHMTVPIGQMAEFVVVRDVGAAVDAVQQHDVDAVGGGGVAAAETHFAVAEGAFKFYEF